MCQTELVPIPNVKFDIDFYKHSSRFYEIVLLSTLYLTPTTTDW